MTNYADVADKACDLATQAGQIIMKFYHTDLEVRIKEDASPVTNADEAADRLIMAGLLRAFPDIPVVSEESATANLTAPSGNLFWLVDPLDGTKEFIGKTDEFTVNIALIKDSSPILGVVHLPARRETYFADGRGGVFFVGDSLKPEPIRTRNVPSEGPAVVISRSHLDAETSEFVAQYHPDAVKNAGSSLKFGMLARGEADLYPRFGRTMEWDTAAGHAILTAAGGYVRDLDGAELRYGKKHFENPPFIASGAL